MFDIIYQENGGRRKRLDFSGIQCSIGRDRKNDVVIRSRAVSRFHAEIAFDKDAGCRLRDLGSKTGTWLNQTRVERDTFIGENDEIVIGDLKLWVYVDESHKLPPASAVQEVTRPAPFAEQPPAGEAQSQIVETPDFMHWSSVVHSALIEQMDLRRKDVHNMSDEVLREEAEQLVKDILQNLGGTLPTTVDRDRLRLSVLNEAIGLGPLEKFLADESISEIMVNNFSEVFVERQGRLERSDYNFSSDQAVLSVIERIITPIGRRIDESSPMVDARLKDGSRVNAIIPPLALKGPSLTIRKFPKHTLDFDRLMEFGSVSREMVEFLRICVEARKNIIVSGGTGSGKTTLLNVLSGFIPDGERIVTVEDAAELKLSQPNLVSLESKPANVEGKGQVSIRDLVRNSLRMRPDRIVVGECRGGEALDMLQAMNTGHDGSLTTAHANSPRDLISRLEVMVLMSGMALPVNAIREQIASAVDVVVQQTRYPCGSRKISSITEVVGVESGVIQLQDIFRFSRKGYGPDGKVIGNFHSLGFIPSFYEELVSIGNELDTSIFRNREVEEYGNH